MGRVPEPPPTHRPDWGVVFGLVGMLTAGWAVVIGTAWLVWSILV